MDPLGDVLEGLFWMVVIAVLVVGAIALGIHADKRDKQHDDKMRQDFAQCQKDHKEWVVTSKNGLDGICVTKK